MLSKAINTKSEEEKRAGRAAYMREYERAKGAIPVKGVQIQCARCGCQTEKRHRSHDWCALCVKPAQLERRRQNRAKDGAVIVGCHLTCRGCGAEFKKVHKRQFYCLTCGEKNAKTPNEEISNRVRAGIYHSLVKGAKAGKRWQALVGYTLMDLIHHLERQFNNGMTWENRGEWHIDHIRPLCSFEFQTPDCPQFREAWALSNLRPLWAKDNLSKSGRRTLLL